MYPQVRSLKACPSPRLDRLRLHRPLLIKVLLVTLALLTAFALGLPLAESVFLAAAILLITRRIKPHRVLYAVDWSLLVMFSGLFILTRCVQSLRLLDQWAVWVKHPVGLLGITAILSNLISNVPAVLLLQSFIPQDAEQAWLLLAAGSTLAGNLTLFGSVANLITVEAAASAGKSFSFFDHLRFGVPLTLMTLGVTYVWIVL
ncbi:MAG: hypothetical protein HC768_14795 [Acaryochloris sp. CRU_2_0]|nr:hypothetical protein [Acaryochloris sp. CRU_2_0]